MRIIQEVPTLSTHAHKVQKRCSFHYKGVFVLSVLPSHDNSDISLSISVTASGLEGLCQLHCIHHISDTDKL